MDEDSERIIEAMPRKPKPKPKKETPRVENQAQPPQEPVSPDPISQPDPEPVHDGGWVPKYIR